MPLPIRDHDLPPVHLTSPSSCEALFSALDLDTERDAGFEIQAALEAGTRAGADEAAERRALYAQVLLRHGDPDGALHEAAQAAAERQTCITLYSHGRSLAALHPQAA